MAWSDNSRKEKSPDIWCSVTENGSRFSKPLNISDTPGVSSEPSVSPDLAGRMAIVWADTSYGTGKAQIFARLSVDSLNDVSNVLNLSHSARNCKHPDVALSSDKMFAIWQEDSAEGSTLKLTYKEIKSIATGPTQKVDPTIRAIPSNSR